MQRKPEKADWVAIVTLLIAIFGAGLSLYQWRNTETDSRIAAAIDVSTKYMQDTTIIQMRNDFLDFLNNKVAVGDMSQKSLSVQNYLIYLDYIATLINNNRVNEDYVSLYLKCQILWRFPSALMSTNKAPAVLPLPPSQPYLAETMEFRKRHQSLDCS
jgi:hypothetical protein